MLTYLAELSTMMCLSVYDINWLQPWISDKISRAEACQAISVEYLVNNSEKQAFEVAMKNHLNLDDATKYVGDSEQMCAYPSYSI